MPKHWTNVLPRLLAGLAVVALGFAAAQGPTVDLSEGGEYQPHLLTADGMSLYLYTEDGDTLACTDACTNNWQPYAPEGEVTVVDGLDVDLVGAVDRPDGGTQVTYGGHPLYTYARDDAAGVTNGQGLGGAFFLVSREGEAIREAEPLERVEMDAELYDELFARGESVYANNCAVCHGTDGAGKIGPGLDENDLVGDTEFLVGRILNGFPEHGMPAFRGRLNDRDIASVATFVRNSWGNDFGGVFEREVSEAR